MTKTIDGKFIREKIDPKQGYKRTEVLAGPSMHYDFSLIQISEDKVMGMAADDAIFMSELPPDKSAYLTFHKSAGKLASSGIMPEYFSASINLPPALEEDVVAHYWNSLNIESKKFQVNLTGRSFNVRENAREPFAGGTTSVGTSRKGFFVTPDKAQEGDRILMTKTAGLEATTILAHMLPDYIEEKAGQYNHKLAMKLFFKTSVLQEVQEAIKFGLGTNGVTSMKVVSEGGIVTALEELAFSGGLGLDVVYDNILLYDEVKEICALFNLDPLATSSMGSILFTMREDLVEDFTKNLVGNGIDVADIGRVDKNLEGINIKGLQRDRRMEPHSFYDMLSEVKPLN